MNPESKLKNQSEIIEMLRFPLIILVVFVHMAPLEPQAVSWRFDSYSLYSTISEIISHHIGQLAVPFFFVFSGYLFFLKDQQWTFNNYIQQLHKRLKTLLIPYLFWNIIVILIIALMNTLFNALGRGNNENYSALKENSVYDLMWSLPVNIPLWYVRDLMIMVLLSPLFYYFLSRTKILGLAILLLLYLAVPDLGIPGLSGVAIMYFGLGSYLGMFKYNVLPFCEQYGKLFLLLSFIFLGLDLYYINEFIGQYFFRCFVVSTLPGVFLMAVRFSEKKRLKNILKSLSQTVFFIYAIHTVYFLGKLKSIFTATQLSNSGWGMLAGYLIIPFICVLIILGIYYSMNRLLPKTLSFITGSRVKQL
ncbi:acyltransferase family protein [Sphingobacterium deserti]|uniref:Putative succinyltransferase involved in succinoglycan biosynthesis n=1 Tax=Sphingobacterium deserti TaxID=1229276 RepID=A0A0B8T0W8_9SPHI|nr:acyltransferase [Sphingobacterium deserti]KGE14156.1 putative succinyltransferase involved in succinoglycan biosynthesis [Sphingobacterium deserti]